MDIPVHPGLKKKLRKIFTFNRPKIVSNRFVHKRDETYDCDYDWKGFFHGHIYCKTQNGFQALTQNTVIIEISILRTSNNVKYHRHLYR